MATVTRENIGNLHDKITVKLSKEDYLPAFDKSLKQYAKQANVPGFRKGNVPAGMVRKMYGQNLFNDEVVKTASRHMEEFLNNEQVAIFGQPMVLQGYNQQQRIDMNAPANVDFHFEIGIKPDVQVPILETNQTLTRYKVAISEKLVNDEIERISRRYGKVEDTDTVTGRENVVSVTYQPLNAQSEPLEGSEKKEDQVLVEKLPAKLQEELMNKKAGDKLMFTPATDFTAEEIAVFMRDSLKADISAAEQHYELEVTKVGVLVPRELDIMLYGEVFPNDNIMDEAGFKAKLTEELQREFDKVSDNRLNDEIFETLVHNTQVELPIPFLKRWLQFGQEKQRNDAEVEREFPGFIHNMIWTLISDKIVLDNGLQVTQQEVFDDIRGRVLAYFGMEAGEEAPWMDGYMQKVAKDEKTINETYRQLMFARLFQFLQGKFNIQEKEISEEEFFKLPSPHEAAHGHQH